MRKLVLQMQMSVDGFFGSGRADPWQVWNWGETNAWDEDLNRAFNEHFGAIDTILLSSRMAEEGYLTHWGEAARRYPADPFYAFAQRILDIQKVVPSNRLTESRWNRTEVRHGELVSIVKDLKCTEGRNIGVFGGAGFAGALIAAELVDELQLYVNPAILGTGPSIFEQTGFRRLRLLGSQGYACGIVVSRYAPG